MENFRINPFSGIITDQELDSVVGSYNTLNNPLYFLFGKNEGQINGDLREKIISITVDSIAKIKRKDGLFFAMLRNRLLDRKSYDGPESSLGEIRAYNSLLDIFGEKIKPRAPEKNKPTSDFEICLKKERIIVEVNSPQPDVNLNEAGKLGWERKIFSEVLELSNQKTVTCNITSRAPFGRERCKNLYENVVHKLTQIKQGDKQSELDSYSILWVDLFDEYISIISDTGIFSKPLRVKMVGGDEVVSTNILWYSVYGKMGFPIYDSKPEYDRTTAIMTHNGKFALENSSKWDMVIYASPLNTVVYQNPYSSKKPSFFLINRINKLSRINKRMSRYSFSSKHLKKVIGRDYNFIEKVKDKY